MATQEHTLDCSDLDQYIGTTADYSPIREPLGNTDIRRWVHAMHYPNLLHFDRHYARESRYGRLVAPQSFPIVMDDSHGTSAACLGRIPESHLLFAGDEWWFEDVPVFGGDWISNERIAHDYVVKNTSLGPTCFQRGDNYYRNQHGHLIAKHRSTAMRYSAALGGEAVNPADFDEPEWTDEELEGFEARRFAWVQMMHDLGHKERWWDDVAVGDHLPERLIGPHSIVSFTTEWRSYLFTTWGTLDRRMVDLEALGFTKEMAGHENDPVMELINPFITDGAHYGPSRGHLFPKYARKIGMPRGYGYGASLGAWVTDYLSGWAGEWGMVVHSVANYRGPALTGDVTIQTAEVTEKSIDEAGRHLVHVKHVMKNQQGKTMVTGTAEIALPKR
jgi:acyl dehydratase